MIGQTSKRAATLATALVVATAGLALAAGGASASEVLYTNIPKPMPGNLPSQSFEATGTSEFGGLVKFGTGGEGFTDRSKPAVTIAMSSWQCQNGTWFEDNCTTAKGAKIEKLVPVTLNVYEVGELAKPRWTVTKEFKMPYRPSANAKCAAKGEPGKWDRMGTCFNGKLFKIHFSLAKVMGTERVPAEWIISVAYNTTDFGYSPTHEAGDVSDNLNVATSPETPELGTDPLPGDAFITSVYESEYCGSGVTPGTFGLSGSAGNPCWTGFQPAIEVKGSSGI